MPPVQSTATNRAQYMSDPEFVHLHLPASQALDEDSFRKMIETSGIDDKIDEESLEILKLSMSSQIDLAYIDLEEITRPSELCYRLFDKPRYRDDPEMCLNRLIYALKILGRRRFGYRTIRRFEARHKPTKHFDVDSPLITHEEKKDFLMRQDLALACRHIPKECLEAFVKLCAEELDGANPRTSDSPCKIITRLLQERKLTVENYRDFIEDTLVEAKLSDNEMKLYYDNCNNLSKFIIYSLQYVIIYE